MTRIVAVSGKGGVGKTTVVCGIVEYLVLKSIVPILVVDADPNSNLAESLGVKYENTIADIREDIRNEKIPRNMSKLDYINIRLQEAIAEHKYFDLLVMGHPEGRECYCYINELLRTFLKDLSKNYKYVIIDTEAGMEHFSRRSIDDIDYLFLLTTPMKISVDTVKRIYKMISKLKLKVEITKVIFNMIDKKNLIEDIDIPIAGKIKKDNLILNYSQEGIPLLTKLRETDFFLDLSKILDKEFLELKN